ncbi:MAG: hypothetical protein U9N59_01805 [Campylobacterota bacterium]|nr:hypothetical protein [Campylobacterota bacterium]
MSKSLFEILDEIIDTKFKVSNSGGKIVFNEPQREPNKCEKVEIQTSKKVFAFSLDSGDKVFNCFNDSIENITKKNDGILIYQEKNKFVVLLIELKSLSEGTYLKQIKAGKNFIEYLLKQINLFYDINIKENDLVFRGLLFKLFRQTPKKGTTQRNKLNFQDADGLLVARLACNSEYKLQMFREGIN